MKAQRIISALLASALLAASLGGCYFLPEEEELLEAPVVKANEVSYTTTAATRRDIADQVLTPGNIASGTEFNARFGTGGNILDIYVSAGDSVEKGALLAEYDTYELDQDIAIKEMEIYREQLEYDIAVEEHRSENVKQKELLDVQLMQNELDKLYEQKEAARLYSEVAGTVSYVKTCSPGDWINPGETVATVIDVTDLYIKINPDDDVPEFLIGRPIQIRYNGEYFDGTIVRNQSGRQWDASANGPLVDAAGEDVLTDASEDIVVKFNDIIPESSAVGNIADTILVLDKRENVIVISANLVKKVDGVPCVYVFKDNERVKVDVTLGLQSGSLVEITSGLEEGDEVIIR